MSICTGAKVRFLAGGLVSCPVCVTHALSAQVGTMDDNARGYAKRLVRLYGFRNPP
jgi:hypothetical protein